MVLAIPALGRQHYGCVLAWASSAHSWSNTACFLAQKFKDLWGVTAYCGFRGWIWEGGTPGSSSLDPALASRGTIM